MKVFAAVTLVVFLCCLKVALSYPNPAARSQGRIAGRQSMTVPQEYQPDHSIEIGMPLYAVHFLSVTKYLCRCYLLHEW